MSLTDKQPHEREAFYKQRAHALQNIVDMMLPGLVEQTIVWLTAKAALDDMDRSLGLTQEQVNENRLARLREHIMTAYPEMQGKTVEEMRRWFGARAKQPFDDNLATGNGVGPSV